MLGCRSQLLGPHGTSFTAYRRWPGSHPKRIDSLALQLLAHHSHVPSSLSRHQGRDKDAAKTSMEEPFQFQQLNNAYSDADHHSPLLHKTNKHVQSTRTRTHAMTDKYCPCLTPSPVRLLKARIGFHGVSNCSRLDQHSSQSLSDCNLPKRTKAPELQSRYLESGSACPLERLTPGRSSPDFAFDP